MKLYAYCGSNKCARKISNDKETIGLIRKENITNSHLIDCPDCGSAIFWSKTILYNVKKYNKKQRHQTGIEMMFENTSYA